MNEPLWSKDHTGYWLLFPNKHALTKDHIIEIFKNYGNILQFTQAGDEKGFRFIQYAMVEEVEAAIKGLARHPLINLIPHRPKNKNKQNSPTKSVENDKKSRNDETCDSRNSKINSPDDSRNYKHSTQSDNISVTSSSSSKSKSIQNRISTGSVNSEYLSSFDRIMKLRGVKADSFSTSSTSTKLDSEQYESDDEIPDLVKQTKLGHVERPKEEIYMADEIIVANVHSNYGSGYILHLLEQYEPLAVSYMKEIPKVGTQFCHVYFKSQQHSKKVEQRFNNFDLCGKKLVVFRPHRLKEEVVA